MVGDPGQRLVAITGAASGIGEALAEHLADQGDHVLCIDRRGDALEDIADRCDGTAIVVDVADADAFATALHEAVGDQPLDCLINNAGVGNLKRLEDYTAAEFDLLVRVNLQGVFNGLKAAKPLLDRAADRYQRPSVVNVASVSGVRPTFGEAPYSAAKAGVVALTMSAALEWAPRIRVNCVSPGFVVTPLNQMVADDPSLRSSIVDGTPLGRLGRVEDVVSAVSFLLGPDSAYMTGQNLVVDGGSTLVSAQVDHVLRTFLGSATS